ncbi:hypothetical protein JZ751_010478 [Albula glossodonta]|uniref:Protein FAM228B n=1 Tax=Albula glossodonta TaxID=121402 RepID=A0A8T2P078_9TELE|nr:hypothetical protein JZ751_010478 [Albula glossodonta]
MSALNKKKPADVINFNSPAQIRSLKNVAEAGGDDRKNKAEMSVLEGRGSCLGNRIPYPSKCMGKRRAATAAGWLSHSSIRQLQANLETENQEAKLITQPLLDTENGFVKDLESYLSHRGTLELRRKELLHKRWTERVWIPIQRSVREQLSPGRDGEPEKLRSAILHYIQYCNSKKFVSLESYDPNEYDPFLHVINRPNYFKVSSPALKDPLLLQSRSREREIRAVLRCQTGQAITHKHINDFLQRSLPQVPQLCCYVPATTAPSGENESSWDSSRRRRLCQTFPVKKHLESCSLGPRDL